MGIQITKIDDKADGFTVEFTVTNTYRRTFPPRQGVEQLTYARDQVQAVLDNPDTAAMALPVVEKPEGVTVVVQPVAPPQPEPVIDVTPVVDPVPIP